MIYYSYVHIPFCLQKCKYCAFTSFINLNLINEYIERLLFEIETKYDKTPQKGLYIGGGTPSLLKTEQIELIIKKFKCIGEVTVEINPENASVDYLSQLLDTGVNRLSIGIQAFDDKILKAIGRCHSVKTGINAIENAHKAGFLNISVDLMYGLPYQTLKNWEQTLKTLKALDITHISTYGLKIEENTFFAKFPPKNLPDENLQAKMYYKTLEILADYERYEISNFAKNENFISKHNLNYWHQGSYNGFGLSSCGFDGKLRYKKTSNLKKYMLNPFEIEEKIELTKLQMLEEALFLGFRLAGGINTDEINKKFNLDVEKKYKNIFEKYLKTGHILKTKQGYKLSTEGILLSNYILCDFLC